MFKNKTVLITGAANGIGKWLAELFYKAGAKLILVDKDGKVIDLAERLNAIYYVADLYQGTEFAYKLREYGVLPDILINNAGIGHHGEMKDTPLSKWDALNNINLRTPIVLTNSMLDRMIARGSGHIVNVSSGQAFFRLPTWGDYTVSKVAFGAWSELLATEVAKYGIDVTTVYPFMVNTGFYSGVEGETLAAKLSMKLLPYYSMSAEAVAEKIFLAIKKKKRVEMISPINYIGFYMRMLPPLANTVSWLVNKLLAK